MSIPNKRYQELEKSFTHRYEGIVNILFTVLMNLKHDIRLEI